MSGIQDVQAAADNLAAAYDALRQAVLDAQASGVPDAAIARAAGVSRSTVLNWTGKGVTNQRGNTGDAARIANSARNSSR